MVIQPQGQEQPRSIGVAPPAVSAAATATGDSNPLFVGPPIGPTAPSLATYFATDCTCPCAWHDGSKRAPWLCRGQMSTSLGGGT
jgi:hypothetical protein